MKSGAEETKSAPPRDRLGLTVVVSLAFGFGLLMFILDTDSFYDVFGLRFEATADSRSPTEMMSEVGASIAIDDESLLPSHSWEFCV